MADEKIEIDKAKASPTKAFFVRMLTRDIELTDAILDLLDNCLDGILRTGINKEDLNRPYAGYHAKITLAPDHFIIEDNCGGIPLDIAKRYAFVMGRPEDAGDPTPSTIGMYGIGMKRAIFKLGTDALVESRSDVGFNVKFTPDWMQADDWSDLPIYHLDENQLGGRGTRITVLTLNHETSACLSDPDWIDNFRISISKHYSLIISKGFDVFVGDPRHMENEPTAIAAEPFLLLNSRSENNEPAIAPYIYSGVIDDVEVEIFAGLYRPLLTADEIEAEEDGRATKDDAGWTVACNDRVVIWKDKTRLTGWGEANVPNYHGQFIAITGIVLLKSTDPKKLPLTTTKRGIDASSNVYLTSKDFMREATKSLTSFTNRWKKFGGERDNLYKESQHVALPELRQIAKTAQMKDVRKFETVKKFEPQYPAPIREATDTRISFLAEKAHVEQVARHFFDTADVTNEQVGTATFNHVLKLVQDS